MRPDGRVPTSGNPFPVEGDSDDARFRRPIVVWTTAQASPSGATVDGGIRFPAAGDVTP